MRLFKKKTEPTICCNAAESNETFERNAELTAEKLKIKVLGAGCKSCHQQYENVVEAVKTLGLDADVQYITEVAQVSAYGVMQLPAIVIGDQIVSAGKIVKASAIMEMLRK